MDLVSFQHTGSGKGQIEVDLSHGVSQKKGIVIFSAIKHPEGNLIEIIKEILVEALTESIPLHILLKIEKKRPSFLHQCILFLKFLIEIKIYHNNRRTPL